MPDDLAPLRAAEFADPLKELVRLLSQPHRAFLLGAGSSKCAGLPLTTELTDLVAANSDVSAKTKAILKALQVAFNGAPTPTIEDFLSELVDWLSIGERRKFCMATASKVIILESDFTLEDVEAAIDEIKGAIVFAINKKPTITTHRQFIRAIHRALQSGKASSGPPVDYFILNYDTLVEDALGCERLSVADGFSGAATGWWDERSFDSHPVAARVFKVHGSIDWRLMDNDVLPHRIRPIATDRLELGKHVVIWPAATKYRETQRDPYAQMLKFFRKALRPPEKSELVLTTSGYRFADAHINLELTQGLMESHQSLTIVAFTEDEVPTGLLKEWLANAAVRDQVRVYAKRGFFHGTNVIPSSTDLPWWKFEVITRLLGGEQ